MLSRINLIFIASDSEVLSRIVLDEQQKENQCTGIVELCPAFASYAPASFREDCARLQEQCDLKRFFPNHISQSLDQLSFEVLVFGYKTALSMEGGEYSSLSFRLTAKNERFLRQALLFVVSQNKNYTIIGKTTTLLQFAAVGESVVVELIIVPHRGGLYELPAFYLSTVQTEEQITDYHVKYEKGQGLRVMSGSIITSDSALVMRNDLQQRASPLKGSVL